LISVTFITFSTMEWGIDDFQVPGARRTLGDDVLNEGCVDFVFAEDDSAALHRLLEIGSFDFGDVHHLFDDRFVVRGNDLAAGGPIDLDGVVAGRVMAGGDHDAAVALFMADQKRQLRRAAVVVEEIDREAVGHHNRGAQLGEVAGVVAGVVGEGAGERLEA
jgi:hypothetical protein